MSSYGVTATHYLAQGGTARAEKTSKQMCLTKRAFRSSSYLFMEVGDRHLERFGSGDLETFGEIIGTLRFIEFGS